MRFQTNTIYHVFNQGNNRIPIFYRISNYFYFAEKMRKHLVPYCDILAYCLMPNHFHWLLIPKERGVELYRSRINQEIAVQHLSKEIGVLLRSYARAINVQEKRSGSLFRPNTKAKDGWIGEFITADGVRKDLFFKDEMAYARQCLEYIHQNPVKADLVHKPEWWYFSSATEYAGIKSPDLCNLERAKEVGLILE